MVSHAIDRDADAIGWLTWAAVEHYHDVGRTAAVVRDGDLVGFASFRVNEFEQRAKIMQVWVRPDARMIEHGRALVHRVAREALRTVSPACLSLWCADDLAANRFWRAMGFNLEAQRLGKGDALATVRRARIRRHNLWSLSCRTVITGMSAPTDGAT